eukprot:GEMP01039083.1.p1 GENE.GEMP01039083.1~~GEMP01039083.1.p1  ORF type:complete len:194 (+),score=25.57 GEMP01039083.1:201-782(+)
MHSARVLNIERNRQNLERWRKVPPISILPDEEERKLLLQRGTRSSLVPGAKRQVLPFIGKNSEGAVDIHCSFYSGCNALVPCARKKRIPAPGTEEFAQPVAFDRVEVKREVVRFQEPPNQDVRDGVAQYRRTLREQRDIIQMHKRTYSTPDLGSGWRRSNSMSNWHSGVSRRSTMMGSTFSLPFGGIQSCACR